MAASNTSPEQWQCGKTLSECLGYMLDKEVSCDITFLLGKEKTQVKAHKTLLIARSPVFYAMLDGPLKEKDVIEIPDIDADAFKIILKFIYTDVVDLTADNVMSVLYAAKKYCLESLSSKCTEFLESNLSDENACLLYEQSHIYDEKELHDKCFKYINENAEKCLKDEHFRDLCPDCCDSIISSDELLIKEELIYAAMLQWSEAECQRHHLDVTNINRRKMMGNLLYKIRFPLIGSDYFAKNILNQDLLSDKEKLAIASITQYKVSEVPENVFNCSRRSMNFAERVIRFQNLGSSWSYGSKEADTISFCSSEDTYLHGLILYGDRRSSSYNVKLNIKSEHGTISTVKRQYSADAQTCQSDILLGSPILIAKNKSYTVEALISGPESIRGSIGSRTVDFIFGMVTFSTTDGKTNGTDIDFGQIPGLLLSSA